MTSASNDTGIATRLTPDDLAKTEGAISTPFEIRLDTDTLLRMDQLLRVLPGRRYVGAARLGEQTVLAKLFVSSSSSKHFQRELAGIRALKKAGIDTPKLIKEGATVGGGFHVLTEFIPHAIPFSHVWETLANTPLDRQETLGELQTVFALLGELHQAGLTHTDLHLDNLLVQGARLMLIDGDAVHGSGDGLLPIAETEANLALLIAQFPVDIESVLDHLLESYHRAYPNARKPTPESMRQAIDQARQTRWADYLGKLGRNCSHFVARQNWRRRCIVHRSHVDMIDDIANAPDEWVEKGQALKLGNSATVVRVKHRQQSLIIKRYNIKNPGHALSRALRPTRAWHTWIESHRLERLGIATPTAHAIIESRFGPLRSTSWLIMQDIPGRDLLQELDASGHITPSPALAHAIIRLFKNLHRVRITHGDLKATNLIWHNEKLYLIDLDATTQHQNETGFEHAWRRDRQRLLRNWPDNSPLHAWLDEVLP